jgi:transcription elongation GreA/GreB family factor
MKKSALLEIIVMEITSALNLSLAAAEEARATATNKENAAENKYDTLGLEAAYLAHGQSERVAQIEKELEAFVSLQGRLDGHEFVKVGSLLQLNDGTGELRYLFVGPAGGGLVVNCDGLSVTVITPDSPLGHALVGAQVDDDVSVQTSAGETRNLISGLW